MKRHVDVRLKQRFNEKWSKKLKKQVKNEIKKGLHKYLYTSKKTGTDCYLVKIKNRYFARVVYDPRTDVLVTIMYPKKRESDRIFRKKRKVPRI